MYGAQSLKLGLGWAYAPGSQISGVHLRSENDNVAALTPSGGTLANAGDDLKVKINLLNWEHMMGQWQLLAQYAWTSSVTGATGPNSGNTQMKGITLAGKYFMSKRTGAYLSFNRMTNQANAWGDFSGGGFSSASATGLGVANAGADVQSVAVGVMHNF